MKSFIIKLFFSLLLLLFFFKLNNIKIEVIKETFRFDVYLITVSFLLLLLSLFFLFIRNLILTNYFTKQNFNLRLIFFYLKSLVLSNLGFSGGGDIYRVFLRKKINISFVDLSSIIFFERGTSFLSIIFLLFIFSGFNFIYLFLAFFLFYIIFVDKKILVYLFKVPYINIFNNRLNYFLFNRNIILKKIFLKVFIISCIIQLISIFFSYSFFLFFYINISFYKFAFIVLVINMILTIPNFTISGFGLRENLYLYLLPVSLDKHIVSQSSLYQSIFLILFWIIIFLVTLTLQMKYPTKNQKKVYSK